MSDIAVRQYDIPLPLLPDVLSPLRIAHLSDFHFRGWTRLHERLQERLLRHRCDMLALTGDFSHLPRDYRRVAELLRRFIEPLSFPLGRYAVLGNHDAVRLAEEFSDGTIRFLINDSHHIVRDGVVLAIAGTNEGWRSTADLPRTLAGCDPRWPTVLLCHVPSTSFYVPRGIVDVVLSGHTHGGQWRIPGLGSVSVNDYVRRRQTHGLHRLRNRWVHISAGVGTSGPFHIRVNCPAEMAVLTLRRGLPHGA